ncbi:uncharacterized protein LOC117173678 [Belonocnema kinseyi]|uniref:uncharacterized protein LOC117173678 n=1 Tax=Belonocnema kinseyi TaxID=2817044 RepID=UPI00143DC601|nr:uncharacterized protein LOC117173678 [Belonocnema kinseyi]
MKQRYDDFMSEYEDLGHMTQINDDQINYQIAYYLPHHAVIREESTTTKLQVVFDGSSKTSTGLSANDILLLVPTIQQDLFSIVLRFRQHRYVLTGEISKMYRQINIQEDQRDLQRILWRPTPKQPALTYSLNTVTYGMASSPFLAIRCLLQLAIENKFKNPTISRVIEQDFYVDDLLTCASSMQELKEIKENVTNVFQSGGFNLCRWITNEPSILNDHQEAQPALDLGEEVKALGLTWESNEDNLRYKVIPTETQKSSKRSILSTISQIFDPLGMVGPCTIQAKIILQKLWQINCGWDESLPNDIHTSCLKCQDQVKKIIHIEIPKQVVCSEPVPIELHGFCDASELAYGACIYLKSTNPKGDHTIRLLCAKSKVAPLKKVTLPRLELCSALLLANMSNKVVNVLTLNIKKCYQ